ncbi:hypothetical protein GCM10022267_91620 [Lentzea roselyniae]|uniref:Uncharacterized protein n=1 Tax=Lentzea roselyniae TaxID=531940 RepID=A0ABP7CM33_9PSEU
MAEERSFESIAHLLRVDSDDPPLENVLPGVLKATDEEVLSEAEEACEKGELPQTPCAMSVGQVERLLPDMKKQVAEMADLVEKSPEARALGPGPRSAPDVGKILAGVAKLSKNASMQKLSDRAGEFADWASRTVTTAGALTENTAEEYAKAVISIAASFVPPLGDLWSLADAVANGNVEQGVVAVVGLAATAIGMVFPPAGAIIAAGLAIYSVGKFLYNYFMVKERDWIDDPPGTVEELFESGAQLTWTEQQVGEAGKANLVLDRDEFIATQTLLLNSTWTRYNAARQPVKYTFTPGEDLFVSWSNLPAVGEAVVILWQDGKAQTSTCKVASGGNESVVACRSLTGPVSISLGHSAVMEVKYIFKDYDAILKFCPKRPCVVHGRSGSTWNRVLSEDKETVTVPLPFSIGVQGDA